MGMGAEADLLSSLLLVTIGLFAYAANIAVIAGMNKRWPRMGVL